jgi:short-subunit dehydrogenase
MISRNQALAPRSVLITGASSGIGAALARAYAAPGVYLALGGRDAQRLRKVAADCRSAGAEVEWRCVDVVDAPAMAAWLQQADCERPLDLVIANAGVSGSGGNRRILEINLAGVVNTVEPAIARMAPRGEGHLALMSSLAAFRGMPSAPAYCASKAAIRIYGEGLRAALTPEGIAVSVVCPGFVRTPLTASNPFPMPLLMSAERAAALIRRGLDRRRARIAFPLRLYLAVRLLAALPPAWVDRHLARLPAKE